MLRSGDVVICLTEESSARMKALNKLNPRRDVKVFDVEEFLRHIEEETRTDIGASAVSNLE